MILELTGDQAFILKEVITLHFQDYTVHGKYHSALRMAKAKISKAISHSDRKGVK